MANQTLSQLRGSSPGVAQVGDVIYGIRGTTPYGMLAEDVGSAVFGVAKERTKQWNFDLATLSALGPDLVLNGDFATDTIWTKGTGWTISGLAAHCDGTQGGNTDLTNVGGTPESGKRYIVWFTLSNWVAGTVTPVLGGVAGTARNTNGTHFDQITTTGTGDLILRGDTDFDGTIDDALFHLIEVDVDLDDNEVTEILMEADFTMNAPTNMKAGGVYTMIITQDAVGSWDFDSWAAAYVWPGGTAPVLTAAAGSIDILRFNCDGVNMYGYVWGADYS